MFEALQVELKKFFRFVHGQTYRNIPSPIFARISSWKITDELLDYFLDLLRIFEIKCIV